MDNRFEIETGRLTLIKPEPSDLDQLLLLLQNPLMTMYREFSFSKSEVEELIKSSKESIETGSVGLRLVLKKNTNELIGFGGVKKSFIQNDMIYAAFMYLHPDCCGLGYGKEALSATINDAFNHDKIDKIHSFIGFANYSMQYLLESLGFLKIGDETINLDYNIVSRAHYILEKETKSDILINNDFFFPLM